MSASATQKSTALYEFGPFRVDAEKEVVLRAGEHVPLTPKTFQILLLLVRHSKEVVTKDDLMKAVWPDTFVEEANLSRNIFMLRKALGENPPNQRYIVTVPGRGYRFAEEVRLVPEQELSIVAAKRSKIQVQVAETKPWRWVAVAVVSVLVVAGVTWRFFLRRPPVLSEKDTVVLADFTNNTGDTTLGPMLREGLSVQLEQSPFVSLISEQRIQQTLRLMGQSGGVSLTPELARQVCERTGSAAVLQGSIAGLGSRYVLGLSARSCRTGEVLDDELVQADRKEDVLNALTQIASKFRGHVGESLASLQQHDTPLAEATTPSLEALEAYSTAWKVHFSNGAVAALPLFKRATEIDPEFAIAHAAVGRLYADLDESELSAKSIRRAWELRERASDREKFFITANYEMLVTGNLENAQQTCETWAQTYPREPLPHTLLAGAISKTPGQYERAVGEAAKAIELDPDFAVAYYNVAVNQAYLNRFDEAENTLRRATGRGLEIDEFVMLDYDIAFLRGDQAEMEKQAARARVRSGGENWISNKEAFALAYSGHLRQARGTTWRAVQHAEQAGQKERAGLWEAEAAVREALYGNTAEAKKSAAEALRLSRNRDVAYGAAFALAWSGDSLQAQAMADDLERRFPEDTAVRFSYLPTLRARLALNHNDASKAMEALEVAGPNELGAPWFGALYPVFVRGECYLALHQGAEAAKEYQKILDHRGIVVSDPIGALARLRLGRAYLLTGDTAKAKAAYRDFLDMWKGADSEIPALREAETEYAKLR